MSALTSDPINNTLIDELMARGLVRDVAEWTDEEAERARLAAFDLAQRNAPLHMEGQLRPHEQTCRNWCRAYGVDVFAVERFFSVFDPDDFALESLPVQWTTIARAP